MTACAECKEYAHLWTFPVVDGVRQDIEEEQLCECGTVPAPRSQEPAPVKWLLFPGAQA